MARTEKNSKGWYNDERTKQKVDWKEGFDFGAQDGSLDKEGFDGKNVWPTKESLPEFESTMREWYSIMEQLSRKLTAAMAIGLGLPYNFFFEHFDECHTSYERLNYYPTCPEPEKHMSISPHTDAGAVTVLSQGPFMVRSL